MKAAVIGSPIVHSLSPAIFAFIAQQENSALDYTAQEVLLQDVHTFLQEIRLNSNYVGLNVTIPLKEAVLNDCDELSEEAATIGAVNVIAHKAGRLLGFNTDIIGIQKTLNSQHFSPSDKTCLIWGAGGSAKAMAYVLGKAQAKTVFIYNPRSHRGVELARHFNKHFPKTRFQSITALDEVNPEKMALVVNTTPVGMRGRAIPEKMASDFFQDLSKITFSHSALAFDLIYTPEQTPFLKKTQALGLTSVGGLDMLIAQALATWEIFVEKIKKPKKLHQALYQHLRGMLYLRENPAPLFLTGLMGTGKSTVGQELAHLTQRTFIDTDQLISMASGMSIPELFSQKGEAGFRQLEKNAVAQAAKSQNTIVSLGGGAILAEDNLKLILAAGPLVQLTADEDTLVKRLVANTQDRPLLAGMDKASLKTGLRELLSQRQAFYEQADFSMETSKHSILQVAQAVISKWGEANQNQLATMTMSLKDRAYPIVVGENALLELPLFLRKRKSKKVFIISDTHLRKARFQLLNQLSAHGFVVHELPVKAGEELKDIQAVYPLYGELLKHKADRDSIILALGGGSVGDAAGFIAATYMRGIDWVSLPTTLLAQVDSGVGGKTGINHGAGKNLIGAFHQPALVICDTIFLKTLSSREMVSGFGEIVKYAIAFDAVFLSYLEQNLTALLNGKSSVIQHCIARSLYWKCKMVAKDEFDRTGIREKLNFGHTFGHALEAATQYQTYQHGEAVILGMRFALALSVQRGWLSATTHEKIKALLKKITVPNIPAELQPQDIFAFMKQDKKAEGNQIRFVLLEKIGKTISDSGVTPNDLNEAYRKW